MSRHKTPKNDNESAKIIFLIEDCLSYCSKLMTIKHNFIINNEDDQVGTIPSPPYLPTRFLARLMHEHNVYLHKPTRILFKSCMNKVTVIAHTLILNNLIFTSIK
jgi:hypothetical protein